jgi:type VI secretion system ImpA/VasJ family protein
MGYRIMRSLRWDIIDKAPPAEDGKIKLEGPNPQQRAYFQKLVADKEWKTLLEKTEAAFTSGGNHLWLDLQRFIVTACQEIGADFVQVRDTIILETALLLKRVPDIIGLSFADGGACCDEATKDWIAADVQTAISSGAGAIPSGPVDPLIEEQRAVNKLVAAGQIEDALTLIQSTMRSSSSERDNFRRTIAISSLLLKAKQPDIATSILETLDRKIDRHGLGKWDPEIAVEAWSTLVMSYKAGKVQKPQNLQALLQDKLTAVLSKIGQIDPGKAFALSK